MAADGLVLQGGLHVMNSHGGLIHPEYFGLSLRKYSDLVFGLGNINLYNSQWIRIQRTGQ